MSNEPIAVPAIDGSTPLGFLAALGVLKVLDERNGKASAPRLGWKLLDKWRPLYAGVDSFDDIVGAVADDVDRWAASTVLAFRYPKREKAGIKLVGAARPPVAILRHWLTDRLKNNDLQALEYMAAFTCETATEQADQKKQLSPDDLRGIGIEFDRQSTLAQVTQSTHFDFTSRNAQFLEQVEYVRRGLARELIADGLRSGVRVSSATTLDWDPTADAPAAIYTVGSAGLQPVVEWLAFRGLAFFPVVGRQGAVRTTSCRGRRKDGSFVWPLWHTPIDLLAVSSLVRYPEIEKLDADERRALGVEQVFRCALTKKADGYTGMFAPSEPV